MPQKPKPAKSKIRNIDAERAAKSLAFVYESGFLSTKRMLWLSFVRGFMHGIGAFVGATLGVGILLWVASVLLDLPLLGSIVQALRDIAA